MSNQAKKITKLCQQAWIELEAIWIDLSEKAEKGNEDAQQEINSSIPVIWCDGNKAGWLEEGDVGMWANTSYLVKFHFNGTSYEDINTVVKSQLV